MARVTARDKADRILLDGRICLTVIRPGTVVRGYVKGESGVYRLGWDGAWWCKCEHHGPGCSHLLAARRVCDPMLEVRS